MVADAQRSRAPIQAPRRHRVRLFRAGGDRRRGDRLPRLVLFGPAPQLAYALVAAVSRAHHRLPLRARPGHADLDHGRDRARRAGRRAGAQRRGARAPRRGRHPRRRQDRHADRGQARPDRRRGRTGLQPTTRCCDSPPRSRRAASIRSPRRSCAAPRARAQARRRSESFAAVTGQGVKGRVEGNAGAARQSAADAGRRHRRSPRSPPAPRRGARTARR